MIRATGVHGWFGCYKHATPAGVQGRVSARRCFSVSVRRCFSVSVFQWVGVEAEASLFP